MNETQLAILLTDMQVQTVKKHEKVYLQYIAKKLANSIDSATIEALESIAYEASNIRKYFK